MQINYPDEQISSGIFFHKKVGFEEGGQIEASNIMAELDSQELQNSINEKTAALSAAQSN